MRTLRPLAYAVVGGLAVAGSFLALGVTGRRTTQTVVQEAPVDAQPASSSSSSGRLTPHALYERDAPGVVFIRAQDRKAVSNPFALLPTRSYRFSTGSGFLLDSSGDILTTYDVIAGAGDDLTVRFGDGPAVPAELIASDPSEDIALLRVSARDLPHVSPLPLGNSTTVRVGDPALAIANPFGSNRTLASGIVSALQGELPGPGGVNISNVIETQLPVYPDSSGGPLLDASGRVIGINSQMRTVSGRGIGEVAFAVPIDTAKALLGRAGVAH